jgi:hypothetical protein
MIRSFKNRRTHYFLALMKFQTMGKKTRNKSTGIPPLYLTTEKSLVGLSQKTLSLGFLSHLGFI